MLLFFPPCFTLAAVFTARTPSVFVIVVVASASAREVGAFVVIFFVLTHRLFLAVYYLIIGANAILSLTPRTRD
jgi:hypothetical protein